MKMNKHKILIAVALSALLHAAPSSAAPIGSTWDDVKKLPDFFSGNWQSRSAMFDDATNTPFTDKAQDYIAHYKPVQDIPYAGAGCKTPGMPVIQRAGSPLKFFYQPGMIAIYIENDSMTRFIKLNGEHSARPNPTYLGESIGHFEGDTLVVDTVGFVDDIILQYGVRAGAKKGPIGVDIPDTILGPHGPNLRMVERIRLVDPDTLEDRLTIYDDTIWKQPYVSTPVQIFKRNHGDAGWPNEWVCSTASIMAFDPTQNKTIEEDPVDTLKRFEKSGVQ
jgi:hypothetical protein